MDPERINLIFDCDGTLVDSYGAITEKIHRIFAGHGAECSLERIRQLSLLYNVGHCIRVLAEENGLDGQALDAEYAQVREKTELITLMDHAEELLQNDRFRSFVYTHRGSSCRSIFDRLGISRYFEDIVDSTYGLKRKPDGEGVEYLTSKYGLDKSRTYYVGDRIVDIQCGRAAGVGTIFLKSSGLDIDCTEADFIVSDLSEILHIL